MNRLGYKLGVACPSSRYACCERSRLAALLAAEAMGMGWQVDWFTQGAPRRWAAKGKHDVRAWFASQLLTEINAAWPAVDLLIHDHAPTGLARAIPFNASDVQGWPTGITGCFPNHNNGPASRVLIYADARLCRSSKPLNPWGLAGLIATACTNTQVTLICEAGPPEHNCELAVGVNNLHILRLPDPSRVAAELTSADWLIWPITRPWACLLPRQARMMGVPTVAWDLAGTNDCLSRLDSVLLPFPNISTGDAAEFLAQLAIDAIKDVKLRLRLRAGCLARADAETEADARHHLAAMLERSVTAIIEA